MFEPIEGPRVFGLPPGADAAARLVDGLLARAGPAPDALLGTTLIVNTARMRRRVIEAFARHGPRALPRIRLIEELAADTPIVGLPPAAPRLRRRLELTQFVAKLLAGPESLAPRAHLYDLADSLNALLEEMHGEGVGPDVLEGLRHEGVDQARHWDRTLRFVGIVAPFFEADAAPDVAERLRLVAEHLAAEWEARPPEGPVVLAGSTGSRGATAGLMRAVAKLPQGALVLPGFDFDLPDAVWQALEKDMGEGQDALPQEDHPQYRFHALLGALDMPPAGVRPWDDAAPADPARAALLSLALRPAPVTDAWLREGPAIGPLAPLAERMTVLEAPGPREEAAAIALGLSEAAARGVPAALVTPDRTLARRVSALLARWNVLPDDSAGVPLHLTAPGRLLRQIARLPCGRIGLEPLIALLKHPLVHSGEGRAAHLRRVRALELQLRAKGPPYPRAADFAAWAGDRADDEGCAEWCAWLGRIVEDAAAGERTLSEHVALHLDLAGRLGGGPAGGSGRLWEEAPGEAALDAMHELRREAGHGGSMQESDYAALLDRYLTAIEVRRSEIVDPRIRILGTQEARVGGFGLAILAGLNETVWPGLAPPDPWLNRALRRQAGLPLPERRVGLAAHDFQQAANAPEVWLTRAVRDGDPTTRSRLMSRVLNLIRGLPQSGGPEALERMRARGDRWLRRAEALDRPDDTDPPAPRPAPAPPVAARPDRWSPSSIRTLIRDPYAVYAQKVLRLRPLHGLRPRPDARLKGILVHEALRDFVAAPPGPDRTAERERLRNHMRAAFAACDWAAERRAWLAQVDRFADWFLDGEEERRGLAVDTLLESQGKLDLGPLGVVSARADRIDLRADGSAAVFDYKTGTPPTKGMQKSFEPQLLIEAMMIQDGAWDRAGPRPVAEAAYLRVAPDPKRVPAPLDERDGERVLADLMSLLAAYREPDRGFAAALALQKAKDEGDYDHLARRGEWGLTDPPVTERIG